MQVFNHFSSVVNSNALQTLWLKSNRRVTYATLETKHILGPKIDTFRN